MGTTRTTATDDEAIVLTGSRKKAALLMLGMALFFAGGILMMNGEGDVRGPGGIMVDRQIAAWVTLVFCGLGLLTSIIMLMPSSTRLRADRTGIEVTSMFRTHRIEWNDVERFYVGYLHAGLSKTKMIAIEYSASYRKQAAGRRFASGLTGMEGGLPDNYTLPAEEVCEILNAAKQRWDAPDPDRSSRDVAADPFQS